MVYTTDLKSVEPSVLAGSNPVLATIIFLFIFTEHRHLLNKR